MSPGRSIRRAAALAAVVVIGVTACDEGPSSTPRSTEASPSPARETVIVDTDLGPDDLMAIAFLLERTDVEVLAVTVSGTGLVHCPGGAGDAAALLAHLDASGVPVACGRSTPMSGSHVFPEEWRLAADVLVEDLGIQPVEGDIAGDASHLLVETIRSSDAPVRVVVLGPMTNLADALGSDASLTGRIDGILAMGGAFEVSGSVGPDYAAEWNIWADEEAVRHVLASGVPIDFVPLDATNDVPVTQFFFETLGRSQGTAGAKLVYRYLATHDFVLDGGSYFFWDPLAAVALVAPTILTFESQNVDISEGGVTTERAGGVPVRVATAADRRQFEEEYLSTLNGGPAVAAYIPDPGLEVTYRGDRCTFEGTTKFEADDSMARVVVEILNETESPVTVVSGTHEGVGWDQLQRDAARSGQTGVPPDYWTETGSLSTAGRSLSGGSSTGKLDLAPGLHALVCTGDEGQIFLLTDLEVTRNR